MRDLSSLLEISSISEPVSGRATNELELKEELNV